MELGAWQLIRGNSHSPDRGALAGKLAEPELQKLNDVGLIATLSIEAGNPKQVLVEAAANWHADSIFVGANRFGSRIESFLLGSVSAAVAARAHCSVEVVRKKPEAANSVNE